MGWMQKLYELYTALENEQSLIGWEFTRKEIKYEVFLDKDGSFVSVKSVSKDEGSSIVPTLPAAEARTGTEKIPAPLVEQFDYFCTNGNDRGKFDAYLRQLEEWADNGPDCLKVLAAYLEKEKLEEKVKTDIPNIKPKDIICFSIQGDGHDIYRLHERPEVKDSWRRRFADIIASGQGDNSFCYVLGKKQLPICNKHSKVQGNAKLISAKDQEFPFQYKGRFIDDCSSARISYEATLKAHAALRWLIDHQSWRKHGMIFVIWSLGRRKIPSPGMGWPMNIKAQEAIDTFEGYAKAVNGAAKGLREDLEGFKKDRLRQVVILGMRAATDGRMSIIYYQEIEGNDYVQRLEQWQKTCAWRLYDYTVQKYVFRTPEPTELAKAVYGEDLVQTAKNDNRDETTATKIMRVFRLELMHCINEGRKLPSVMVQQAFDRAVFPVKYQKDDKWDEGGWRKSVAVTCALIRKRWLDEGQLDVLTDHDTLNNSEDFLCGKLFAVLERMEEKAREKKEKANNKANVITITLSKMPAFVRNPSEGFMTIHEKLLPNIASLGSEASFYQNMIGDLLSRIRLSGRKALGWGFLIGYAAQRDSFFKKQEKTERPFFEYRFPENRSEKFGCMLAIADQLEAEATRSRRFVKDKEVLSEAIEDDVAESEDKTESADNESHEGRTNALRYMNAFAMKPLMTWRQIHTSLIPYIEKSGKRADRYLYYLSKIEKAFSEDELSQEPLSVEFLEGFYRMRRMLRFGKMEDVNYESSDENCIQSRTQAYGIMIGLADRIERYAMKDREERITNAYRYIAVMGNAPERTWPYLRSRLDPYLKLLKGKGKKLEDKIRECEDWLADNPEKTGPLRDTYLHYFYSAR